VRYASRSSFSCRFVHLYFSSLFFSCHLSFSLPMPTFAKAMLDKYEADVGGRVTLCRSCVLHLFMPVLFLVSVLSRRRPLSSLVPFFAVLSRSHCALSSLVSLVVALSPRVFSRRRALSSLTFSSLLCCAFSSPALSSLRLLSLCLLSSLPHPRACPQACPYVSGNGVCPL
jgi:hypothetical protein